MISLLKKKCITEIQPIVSSETSHVSTYILFSYAREILADISDFIVKDKAQAEQSDLLSQHKVL